MLAQRVMTAIGLVAILAIVLLLLPPMYAVAALAAMILAGAWEWAALAGLESVPARIGYVGACALAMAALWRASLGLSDFESVLVVVMLGWVPLFAWIAQDSRLLPTLCPHHPHLAAEVRYAFEVERAATLNDFLFRRTWMALSPCHGRDALPRIESIARQYVPELADRFDAELAAYATELAAMTAFRGAAVV